MTFLFLVLLCASFLFSSSETALFGLSKVTRSRLEGSPRPVERIISGLLDKPRDLLVTVLLGNELTNIALSIVGASVVADLTAGQSLVTQTVVTELVVLPLLLVFGEVTPKVIAARRPEVMARLVARPLALVKWGTTPLRPVLRMLTDAVIARLGGPAGPDGRIIAEAEFRTMIDVGHEAGVVEQQEHTLIHNVLDFGDLVVADVMQPFEDMLSFSERLPVEEAIRLLAEQPHSRVPVWAGDPRQVTGVVFAKELLAIRWGVQPPVSLRRLKRPVLFCPPTRPAAELLEEFRRHRMHLAIVVNEFGAALGMVTMEDLLEELVGPISDDLAEAEAEAAADAERLAVDAERLVSVMEDAASAPTDVGLGEADQGGESG